MSKELHIKQIPYEAKQTILAAVFNRMDKNATLFQDTYGTTFENIKSDTYLLECFIEDLERCCLYTTKLDGIDKELSEDMIEGYIVVVTDDDDIDWCIAFLD